MKVAVHHWRFESGGPEYVGESVIYPTGYREGLERGHYCWVYTNDNQGFEQWMDVHCPTAEYTHRFNSGDPMYTVIIKDEGECMLFKLRWGGD
jgi:hypothetical protein